METYIIEIMILGGAIFASTEALGKVTNFRKDQVALVLGPAAGGLAWLAGFLQSSADIWWKALPFAMLMGLVSTVAAGLLKDKVMKPMQKPKV